MVNSRLCKDDIACFDNDWTNVLYVRVHLCTSRVVHGFMLDNMCVPQTALLVSAATSISSAGRPSEIG